MLHLRTNSKLAKTIFSLFFIPLAIYAATIIVDPRSRASSIPANIILDTQEVMGPLSSSLWQNYSQGGEEPTNMIGPVVTQVKSLKPQLIRIDHLYDYYNVYNGPGNYDFSRLDEYVKSILTTGALPMLSISYTPASLSKSGQVAGEPNDWNEWYSLVRATARHYSVDLNISGIYYEVGNEPDLFGGWHYSKSPNYLQLYESTSRAVVEGAGSQLYKIGGPATTSYYTNWVKALLNHVSKNKLRLDFISWHHYSKSPEDFEKNIDSFTSLVSQYPNLNNIERLITEIGIDSEPNPAYDNQISATHTLYTIASLAGKVHRIFSFELVDGPIQRGEKFSGWGLISHPNFGAKPKPRYAAMLFINQLSGSRLALTGNGSWVNGLATKNGQTTQILLTNYDYSSAHTETVPILFRQLIPGEYRLTKKQISGTSQTTTITSRGTTYQHMEYMEPNTAVILELTKI